MADTGSLWWERDDLHYHDRELYFNGRPVQSLYREKDIPLFVYSASRVRSNLERLRGALDSAGFGGRSRIRYAMKANRFSPLLTFMKMSGLCGIDACSPREADHALSCGFEGSDISFTAGSLSGRDYDFLAGIEGLRMNCDSIQAIRRWGELKKGSSIGIRINPTMGIGRASNEKLQYSGKDTTKFGVYREQFIKALDAAAESGLEVNAVHFHTGCGYLTPQLPLLDGILEEAKWFLDQVPRLETVNIGGGLGVPHTSADSPLDLDSWGRVLHKHFGRRTVNLEIEPGDYIVKDAGILLLNVTYVEQKQNTLFAGLNAGFNIALEPAVYNLPFHPVPVIRKDKPSQVYTLAGNINEALDIWYRDIALPTLNEADQLVLINGGAYSSSMASNHCLRGEFREYMLFQGG